MSLGEQRQLAEHETARDDSEEKISRNGRFLSHKAESSKATTSGGSFLRPHSPQPRPSHGQRASTASYFGGRSRASLPEETTNTRPSMVLNINETPGAPVSHLFLDQEDGASDGEGKLGTFTGVYKPTCLMMWGVIIFIRFGELAGQAGIGLCILGVFISALAVSFTTASVSAMVSNGVPSGEGGVYRLLTRSLGASIGGSFSVLYFLGLTVMACVEMVGFTEALHHVMVDEGLPAITGSVYADQILVGLIVYVGLFFVMLIGHRVITPASSIILVMLLTAYLAAFAGMFASAGGWQVGEHWVNAVDKFLEIGGLGVENFSNNFGPNFTEGKSFSTVLTFVFPCFICVFRGAGTAHLLKTPSKSVPRGAFGAVMTSMTFYILIFCLLGSVAPRETLKEDFLLFERIAWPTKWLTTIGLLVVPLGAAMEYLELAQGILRVLGVEGLLPFLKGLRLDAETSWGVPYRALTGSMIVALPFLFIPNLDIIATVVTMLYLLNYAAVNLSCFLLTVLGSPAWRPKFKYFHKYFTALTGFVLCAAIMFTIQWSAALAASIIFVVLAIYIEVRSDTKIWGHGIRGLEMHIALQALIALEQDQTPTQQPIMSDLSTEEIVVAARPRPDKARKSFGEPAAGLPEMANFGIRDIPTEEAAPWRPQVLVMVDMMENYDLNEQQRSLLDFVRMLTKSSAKGGLIIAGNIMVTNKFDSPSLVFQKARLRKATLLTHMQAHKLSGFAEIVQAPSVDTGMSILLQTAGLGCLRPNTLVAAWVDSTEREWAQSTVALIAQARADNKAMLFVKGLDTFPSAKFRAQGFLDIWWVIQEGGLLLLVGHLLKQHRTWRLCTMRVFTVASANSNSQAVGAGLEKLLKNLRIPAQVYVVELPGRDELRPFEADFTVYQASQHTGRPRPRLADVFPGRVSQLIDIIKPDLAKGANENQSSISSADATKSKRESDETGDTSVQMVETKEALIESIPANDLKNRTHNSLSNESTDQPAQQDLTMTKDMADRKPQIIVQAVNDQLARSQQSLPPSSPDQFLVQPKDIETHLPLDWAIPELAQAIGQESSESALVILNLPVPNTSAVSHAQQYMALVNELTAKVPRCVLAHGLGDGTQVISVFNC